MFSYYQTVRNRQFLEYFAMYSTLCAVGHSCRKFLCFFWKKFVSFKVPMHFFSQVCNPDNYYNYYYHFTPLRVFHWSVSDSKCFQVSQTLLCILANLNKAIVWMVSTRPFISKSSSLCTKHLVTVPSTPITIGITVIFICRILNRWINNEGLVDI